MAEFRSDEEQAPEITQEQQEFLHRVGIVLHGIKAIAEYMGVSAATISRWRTRFRGREEIRLCFPAILIPTGKGWGFRMISHTGLIQDWMERWAAIDAAEAQKKAKWRRRTPKVKRIGETSKLSGLPIEKEKPQPVRAGVEETPCPCGVPDRCLVHGDSGQTLPEEPPVKVISQPEPPTVELAPSPVNLPTPPRQSGIKRIEGCVCGKGLNCTVHDEPA